MRITRTTAAVVSFVSVAAAAGLSAVPAAAAQAGPQGAQRISVDEYVRSGGDPSALRAGAKAPTCWSKQFTDSLSIWFPVKGDVKFAVYGYTGKWCLSGSSLWRMAIMNAYTQNTGAGTVVYDSKSHRTIGRTVWNNKYAIGVEQFSMAGTVSVLSFTKSFSFDRCIRSWGNHSGRSWQSGSCNVT
ncbi:hypothetical protein [Streptomyces cinnamoneus]|uniref:hypothetical protein n=1 Tax=Streptomyces cinnamoneus TaxID=53446 RepID=UPI00167DA288|nr:hypothetical protein [Streptomyces cinnamoneus]